jgi:hypothetical protein
MNIFRYLFKVFQYATFYFDDMLIQGSSRLIAVLALVSSVFILFVSFFTWQLNLSEHSNYIELFWALMMRSITPDYFDIEKSGYAFALIALMMTIFGIFILSTLIGLINTIIDSKINQASEGTQTFPFEDHFVIVGWSARVPTILEELINKNDAVFTSKVLVLLPYELKDDLPELIKLTASKPGVRIFYRVRDLLLENTYLNANMEKAKSVLIIGNESKFQGNYRLKILLGVRSYLDNKFNSKADIIIEVKDHANVELFNTASSGRVIPVSLSDIPARLMVQTIQQPSLPSIYEELFSFEGNEIYIGRPDTNEYIRFFDGGSVKFSTLKKSFLKASVFGIAKPNGKINISPDADYFVSLEDRLISISEDKISFDTSFSPNIAKHSETQKVASKFKILEAQDSKNELSILLLGFSLKHDVVIESIIGSPLKINKLVIALPEGTEFNKKNINQEICNDYIQIIHGKTDDKDFIHSLDIDKFTNIIITHTGLDQAGDEDSATMRTLLYIKGLLGSGPLQPHITMEMTIGRNRDLVRFGDSSDFVVSESISSKVFAQYIDAPDRRIVISELLNLGKSDIVMISISEFSRDQLISYGELSSEMIDVENVVIGWSYYIQDKQVIKLNPNYEDLLPAEAVSVSAIVVTSN